MYHPRFKGSHYNIGLKFGSILKKEYVDFDKIIKLDSFQKEFGKKSQAILLKVFPEVCEEIRGITDGLNYSYEKFATWLLCMGCCYDPRGCTAFCFIHNNNVFYGRNNDLPPFLKKLSKSILYRPETVYSFIGNTSSMVNLEEGFNEKGLAAAMTFLVPVKIVPGINSVFLVRYIAEKCSSVEEAVSSLKKLPVASPCNIILADKTGDMAVAECTPDEIFIRRPPGNEKFLVVANHFISDEMQKYNAANWNIYSSDERYKTAFSALKNITYTDSIEHAKKILSGKHGFMCQYDKAADFETIWSTVFNISGSRLYIAEGDPVKVKFKEDRRFNKLVSD